MDVMTTSALTPTMSAMVASTQFLGAPLQMMMVAPRKSTTSPLPRSVMTMSARGTSSVPHRRQ